jgi:hypothetical protein
MRNFPPIEPFTIQWTNNWIFERVDLDPSKLKKAPGRQTVYSVDQLLEVLAGQELTDTEWRTAVEKTCGMKRMAYYAKRDQLEREGRVYCSALNQKWTKTVKEIDRSQPY